MFAQLLTIMTAVASLVIAAPALQRRGGSGTMTYYNPNGGTGSCGTSISNSDMVCAVGTSQDPSSLCGSGVTITANGKSVSAKIADTCASCGSNHIDCTPSVFSSLGSQSDGVLDVEFSF